MKNEKLLLVPVCIFFFLLTANAQPRPGIKAGLNYTSLTGLNGDNLLSFHAGFFVHLILDKNWRIQPELLYSGEGVHSRVDNKENTDPLKNTMALRYVTLPLMVQYFPLPSLYFEAGPQLAVLTGAFIKGAGEDHMNVKRSFRNNQFGLNLGTGVFFNEQIGIYGRYYFGLTDVTPYNSDMNRSHAGQFGIAFRFKHKSSTAKTIALNESGSGSR